MRLARSAWPLAVAAAAFALAVGLPASDPDMWWHLASGRWMLEHRDVLRVDVFSSTATGEPYVLGEWLGEIVLYAVYAAASWPGVLVLRAALVAVAAFAATRSALRAAPPGVAVPLAAAALLLSKPVWTDRPQLFTLALFPVLLELLLAARAGSRGALAASVPLLFVWSDLHGGYAVGLVLLWLFALDALLERREAGAMVAAAAIATALVLANPGALPLTRSIGHVVGATRGIVEESPVDVLTPFGALFALFVGATFASFLLGGGSLLGGIVLVPMLWLALSAQRHVPLFGFAAVPFLAGPLAFASRIRFSLQRPGQVWVWKVPEERRGPAVALSRLGTTAPPPAMSRVAERSRARERSRSWRPWGWPREVGTREMAPARATEARDARPPRQRRRRQLWRKLPRYLALALWIGALASIATIPTAPDTHAYPAGALPALRTSSGILFNEFDWGGYLIWNAPERPVFIDGRLFPYVTDGVLGQYRAAIAVLPGWRATLARWNVSQALLRPDRPLAAALRDDGWIVRSQGAGYVLLERPR